MLMQTLTGVAQDIGAGSAGGTVTATPAYYPQSIGGVLLSSTPVVATVNVTTGAFSLSLPKTAQILITAKDTRGKTYFAQVVSVSNDDAANISQYLPTNAAGGLTPAIIDGEVISIRQRRRTAAEWAALNPVLAVGEIGFASDSGVFKVGDGATAWNAIIRFHRPITVSTLQPSGGSDGDIWIVV